MVYDRELVEAVAKAQYEDWDNYADLWEDERDEETKKQWRKGAQAAIKVINAWKRRTKKMVEVSQVDSLIADYQKDMQRVNRRANRSS